MTLAQHLRAWAATKAAQWRRWWRTLGAETHKCPDRANCMPGVLARIGEHDFWCHERNGDRTCSYCGSLHPDDFQRLCEAAQDDTSGVEIEPSTKGYKTYVRQPGVSNASEGGIKFYHWHRDRDDSPAFAAFESAYVGGVMASRARFLAKVTAAE